jgi:hypothetical protein
LVKSPRFSNNTTKHGFSDAYASPKGCQILLGITCSASDDDRCAARSYKSGPAWFNHGVEPSIHIPNLVKVRAPGLSILTSNDLDKQRFRFSTAVSSGNGQQAHFWEFTWLEGRAPRDLAPNLFRLARRKSNTVAVDLLMGSWLSLYAVRGTTPRKPSRDGIGIVPPLGQARNQ